MAAASGGTAAAKPASGGGFYRRAEWKCDARNQASRRAALAYGFLFEGIQDAHYIIKDRNRDTAWFRMLASEWPVTAPRLRAYAASRSAA